MFKIEKATGEEKICDLPVPTCAASDGLILVKLCPSLCMLCSMISPAVVSLIPSPLLHLKLPIMPKTFKLI